MAVRKYLARIPFSISVFIIICVTTTAYEKTLRKIVRSQSKMVQRPFSDTGGREYVWKNTSKSDHYTGKEDLLFHGYSQVKTVLHKKQLSKISTVLFAPDTDRSTSGYSLSNVAKRGHTNLNEFRTNRDTFTNTINGANNLNDDFQSPISNLSYPGVIAIKNFYQIPTTSNFFPPINKQISKMQLENYTTLTENLKLINNNSESIKETLINRIDLPEKTLSTYINDQKIPAINTDIDKIDFLVEEVSPFNIISSFNYSITINPSTCSVLHQYKADIDAQKKFLEFDIEPPWIINKHFWNNIFNTRYNSLMRNPKWPPLKVILIPRTHVDTIWKQTFEQYHNNSVHKIISNVVKKLQFYTNLTFNWNEVSHLSQWWKTTTQKNRSAFRRLIREGRLEITTGGWVEPDEATTHIFGLVHQLIEGHTWLKYHLNYIPTVAWLTNSVAHSPTMAYLLSLMGISKLILTNLHFSWEQYLAEYQYSDFVWVQSWDVQLSQTTLNDALNKIGRERFPKHSVLTHYLQFNSAGFKACGPDKAICVNDFNFAKLYKNVDINSYNIKEKSEMLLEQYSKTGTITPHNVIISPIGGPYHYELQTEFDFQFNNYQKIAEFVNVNSEIYKATFRFGTPKDYFKTILDNYKTFPSLRGDFLNFADINNGMPAYWAGYFTSRPLLKILLRRLESTLRSTEILFTFALSSNAFRGMNISNLFQLLIKTRETVARFLDRNVTSGTLTANVLKYIHKQILATMKDCWYIQEISGSLLSIRSGQNQTYLHKYIYRKGEFISAFRTVSPGDQIYVFNSLSHERTEVVELVTRNPNIRIVDHNRKDVIVQINPIWSHQSESGIKISRQFFAIIFAVNISPMTLELYKIKETYDISHSISTIYCVLCKVEEGLPSIVKFPFSIQPVEDGDIQLESYKHRLIIDEVTGFLQTVIEKDTNIRKTVSIDYGAFRSSDINSGIFLFNSNLTKPIHDILMPYRMGIKTKNIIIVSGQVTTELTSIFGRFLQSTVKIFNLSDSPLSKVISIESNVDYEVSPKNRELELFLSIQTDISNGYPPEIVTDNNGFQYTPRAINISRRIESNIYPISNMVFIQDEKSRLTLVIDHSQGVTALHEGHLALILDRRVLFNDGRGTDEGLADSSSTHHKHIILLENFIEIKNNHQIHQKSDIKLPSLAAIYTANTLNYFLDIYFIDKVYADLCYYTYLPLIKTTFPCDVFVLNFRLNVHKSSLDSLSVNTGLMILHRQSFTCEITEFKHLNKEVSFTLEKILRNVKAIYQTNLCGTNEGIPLTKFDLSNLRPMELATVRIYF